MRESTVNCIKYKFKDYLEDKPRIMPYEYQTTKRSEYLPCKLLQIVSSYEYLGTAVLNTTHLKLLSNFKIIGL